MHLWCSAVSRNWIFLEATIRWRSLAQPTTQIKYTCIWKLILQLDIVIVFFLIWLEGGGGKTLMANSSLDWSTYIFICISYINNNFPSKKTVIVSFFQSVLCTQERADSREEYIKDLLGILFLIVMDIQALIIKLEIWRGANFSQS
jgi:hypothetical protein